MKIVSKQVANKNLPEDVQNGLKFLSLLEK